MNENRAEEESSTSILDHPAISGSYLFPQDRIVRAPFVVTVGDAQLACYRRIVDPDQLTIMHFHGNGEAVADYVPDLADLFAEMGLNSLFVEYREYGGSTGRAQLAAMLPDGKAVLDAAGLDPTGVVAFGRSIGSLYAIELVSRAPEIAGLILESGIAAPAERFLAYSELSAAGIREDDVLQEASRRFNHRKKLAAYQNPLLILHTENDGLVDMDHAERNYRWAASSNKRLVRFPLGSHNTIFHVNFDEYLESIRRFIEVVRPSGE